MGRVGWGEICVEQTARFCLSLTFAFVLFCFALPAACLPQGHQAKWVILMKYYLKRLISKQRFFACVLFCFPIRQVGEWFWDFVQECKHELFNLELFLKLPIWQDRNGLFSMFSGKICQPTKQASMAMLRFSREAVDFLSWILNLASHQFWLAVLIMDPVSISRQDQVTSPCICKK